MIVEIIYLWVKTFRRITELICKRTKEMISASKLPLTSTHWGTYRARVSNGRVQELLPFEHDEDPSKIGTGILDVQDGPTRINAPMVRKSWLENGPGNHGHLRGVDPFIEISWDKAEDDIRDSVASRGLGDVYKRQVQEDNKIAVHTYKKNGYVELNRRPFVSFLGSHDSGDYLLMGKNL